MNKVSICHNYFLILFNDYTFINPFPHTASLQQTTLKTWSQKHKNLYKWLTDCLISEKSWKYCCKRRNWSFFPKTSAVEAFESIYMWEWVNRNGCIFLPRCFKISLQQWKGYWGTVWFVQYGTCNMICYISTLSHIYMQFTFGYNVYNFIQQ